MNLADKIYEILVHVKKDEFEAAYKEAQERLAVMYGSYFSCEADGLRRSLDGRASDISNCVVEPVLTSKNTTVIVTKTDEVAVDVSNNIVIESKTDNRVIDIKQKPLTKKEQRQMEREKNEENKRNKISYKKLMTKENLYKWKIEESMSAARIAREILGCREEIVGAELKKHQII